MGFLNKLKSRSDSNLRRERQHSAGGATPSPRPTRAAAPQHPPRAPVAKDEWVLLSEKGAALSLEQSGAPPQLPPPQQASPPRPPRSSSRLSTSKGYITPSHSVQPGQVYASPPFYPQSPPTSEGGHASLEGGAEALSAFGKSEGGAEQWRNVLGGAYRPPPGLGQGGEENGALRSTPKRRESLLGMVAGREGTDYQFPPPKDEFVSRPPRRSSMLTKPQDPATPSRSAAASPSTPARAAASSLSNNNFTPTATLHSPPLTSNNSSYSPLQAFFGNSPTPSHSSTFGSSMSPTHLSQSLGGKSLLGGIKPETPPTPPLSEDPFSSVEIEEPKPKEEPAVAEQAKAHPPPPTPPRHSIEQESPTLTRRPNGSRPSQDSQRTNPVVAQASQNLQDSVRRPSMETTSSSRKSQESQRQKIPHEDQPKRASMDAVQRGSMETARSSVSSTVPKDGYQSALQSLSSSPVQPRRDQKPQSRLSTRRTSTPPPPSAALEPALPVSPPPPKPTPHSNSPTTSPKSAARASIHSSPTQHSKSRQFSPPSTPSRRVKAEATPRAAALAKARERSESESPKDVVGIEQMRKGSEVEEAVKLTSDLASEEPEAREAPIEEQRPPREKRPRPRFEQALVLYPDTILKRVLGHLGYGDFCSLRITSRSLKRCVEVDAKELVLQRFLGTMGYRSLTGSGSSKRLEGGLSTRRPNGRPLHAETTLSRHATGPRARGASEQAYSSSSTSPSPSPPLTIEPIILTLRDLDAFLVGLEICLDQYARFAAEYSANKLHPNTLRLIRASTRAWNRVVLRLRAQSLLPSSALEPFVYPFLLREESRSSRLQVYKNGRAPGLRVWVPTQKGASWMDDGEVVECEREVWRSGAWKELRRGDVVANVAIQAWGNVGKLLHDGKYLRDFSFAFDVVGHLPPWLNALSFSPGYYHNVVASSTANPVTYLTLQAFLSQVRETITLCDDKVQVSSPQGNRVVKRFVYRAALKIKPGAIVSAGGGVGGSGPGGVEVAHDDWAGTVILEVDGSTEHANLMATRVSSLEPTPYRVVREKSRPGKLWLRPVEDTEAC
ncbi:hypothetical protein BCR35DRAFT_306782 [Leucosporidium creatinivorum]|uniref:F-box domain-containing protein n=1 Tax=Leucosporidium creatinivorum TaxID=106004 RepID=A0A1Y2ERU3_9BASI|nr:hypothetical protein BCR35DRAFT_306782 [Leucosporidium creatinivorum]